MTSPLFATVTVVPVGNVGFAVFTAVSTAVFSAGVNWAVLSTTVLTGLFGVNVSAVVGTTVVGTSSLVFFPTSF